MLGLISVVARMKKTNNRKIRSVIDDAENVGSVLELLFIAIVHYFCTGWFKISIKAIVVASILKISFSMRATR